MYDPFGIGFDWGGGSGAGALGDPLGTLKAFSPIAIWPFTDGAGTTLTDISGNNNHATLNAGAEPTWVASPAHLSFNDAHGVNTPSLPAIQGLDIVFRSDNPVSASLSRAVLLANIATALGSGVVLGSWTGSLTNEIIAIAQNTGEGYSNFHRRAWTHATENIAAGIWTLLQSDWQGADPFYNLVVDGVDKANTTVLSPEVWKAGVWGIGNVVSGGGLDGFIGDIAYLVFYPAARSTAQQANCRKALIALMAARGIALP